MHVAPCGVGDMLAFTAWDESLESDGVTQDSDPSLQDSLERRLPEVELL